MITVFLIIAVIIGITSLILWQDYRTFMERPPILKIAVGILLIIAALFQPVRVERIDAGAVGILVNLYGSDRGVADKGFSYKTGWVLYNGYTEQVVEYPTSQQSIAYDTLEVITKGGFAASIHPALNYSLKPEVAGEMFTSLRKPLESIEQGWLKNSILGAVNDVANQWPVDSIFNDRERFENGILRKANERVGQWFTISQLRTNILPPKAMSASIIAKTTSIQAEQVAINQLKVAEAEARTAIAKARGDSAQRVISALAEAEVIRAQQREITPQYIEYLRVTKWDGKYPTTVAGGQVLLGIK